MTTPIKIYSFMDKTTYDATFTPENRAGDLELGWITLEEHDLTFPGIVQDNNVLAYADDWQDNWRWLSLTNPEDLKRLASLGRFARGPFVTPDGQPSYLPDDFLP